MYVRTRKSEGMHVTDEIHVTGVKVALVWRRGDWQENESRMQDCLARGNLYYSVCTMRQGFNKIEAPTSRNLFKVSPFSRLSRVDATALQTRGKF